MRAGTAVVQRFRIAVMTTLDDRTSTPGGSHSDHLRMKLILNRCRIALCLTALVTASCQQRSDAVRESWRDPSPHRTASVQIGGLRLQYLSWGDHGEAVVFVHGSGDSPLSPINGSRGHT